MGILSVIRSDVEELVKAGYPNDYISKSVGLDISMINYIVNYVTKQQEKPSKINSKEGK